MKRLFILAALICCTSMHISAQAPVISEPEFIGEVIAILPDGTSVQLEKENIQLRTRANASAVIFGVGKSKTKLIVESPKAGVRLSQNNEVVFILRAVDNASDPLSIINVFRFENTEKRRLAEMASISSFGSVKHNKLDHITYKAKKYGEGSYLIKLDKKSVGEYGIIIRNPNRTDEKNVIVSTFAIE